MPTSGSKRENRTSPTGYLWSLRKLSSKSRSRFFFLVIEIVLLTHPWDFHRRFREFCSHHPGTENILDDHRCLKPFPHQTFQTYSFDKTSRSWSNVTHASQKNSQLCTFPQKQSVTPYRSFSFSQCTHHFRIFLPKLQVFRLHHYLGRSMDSPLMGWWGISWYRDNIPKKTSKMDARDG